MANHRLEFTGKFGTLTILRDAPVTMDGTIGGRGKRRRVICQCDCGKEVTLRIEQLTNGEWTACPDCTGTRRPRRGRLAIDMAGQVFGRLTVTSRADTTDMVNGVSYWNVRCSCGVEKRVQRSALLTGKTQSCGCLQREGVSKRATKHQGYRTPEYLIWNAMRQRCDNPKNPAFHHYGGRGIRYQDSWKHFKDFIADVGQRPSPELTLDRIDFNGPYSKENCRWATRVQQAQNRSFLSREDADALRAENAMLETENARLRALVGEA